MGASIFPKPRAEAIRVGDAEEDDGGDGNAELGDSEGALEGLGAGHGESVHPTGAEYAMVVMCFGGCRRQLFDVASGEMYGCRQRKLAHTTSDAGGVIGDGGCLGAMRQNELYIRNTAAMLCALV